MKRSLAERIDNRKIKKPSFLVDLIMKIHAKIIKRKLNVEVNIIDKLPKKGPCFIIFNHLSRLDSAFVMLTAKSRRINFVAAYHEHFNKKYYLAFKLAHTIPKRNFVTDIESIANIKEAIDKGCVVAVAPEARNSNYGTNTPIMKNTGKFLTKFNVPIYLVKIHGSYLTFPKFNDDSRSGKISVELKRIPLETIKPNNLDNYINEQFRNDEFEWQNKEQIKWSHQKGMAAGIESVLFQCPKCHQEFTLTGKDEKIVCKHCGYKASLNEYYVLHEPLRKFTSISEWARWERKNIIKDIRKNKKYSFEIPVTLETLDKYHTYKKSMGTESGSGVITIDHNGIYFNGKKNGSSFQLNMSYQDVYTIGITPMIRSFFLYYHNEYYHFIPEIKCALKVKMLVEEMQRLHFNIWPNFIWEKDLYR